MTELVADDTGSYRHPGDPGEPGVGLARLSVTDLEAAILAAFVAGRVVLEIGTGLGVSTRGMASSAAHVVTVDPDPWVQRTIWPDLPANVTTAAAVPDDTLFSAVFIDGYHTTPSVAKDMALALTAAAPGAVILAHDMNHPSVRNGLGAGAWRRIPTEHGIGVLWL